jgi:D-serine deaminase-like pyridoxal phosphate-dependent protein
MASFLAARGKGFRPHAKTHKCPLIARRQLAAGAVGICAAKVSEAAVLVNAGISDVLITSPVLHPEKAAIVARLTRDANVSIVVDHADGVSLFADALDPDAKLGILVDVDVDMGRTGTRKLDDVLKIAELAATGERLTFAGVQHYAGHLMHVEGFADRRSRSLALWDQVAEMVEALDQRGFTPKWVTGCGTGTYNIDCDVECVTDLQVGSYIFMDQEYRLIGGEQSELFDDFEVALTVASTAISQPLDVAITVDAGYKAFASDTVNPEPLDLAGCRYRFAGDEHGVLLLGDGSQEPLLGSVQRFVTPHCDPTVNLYDDYWVIRDGLAVERWPITARGCSW